MKKESIPVRNSLLLLLTATIWGVAFVAQSVSMDYIGGFTFNAVRNLIGALTLLPVIWGLGKTKAPEEKKRIQASSDRKTLITGGICCGILLCFASNFQQFGIKYTSVGKAGFITACYIVIVPIIGIFLKKKCSPFIWIAVGDCKVVDSGRTDKYGKPVFTCYDKFKVSRIGYDTDRNIIDLVIVDKKGKAVFSISRVDENGNKPDDPPALEEKYVNSLFLELKRTGVGLSSLLKSFNVSDVHELRFEQWKSAMDQLKTKPDKA